MVQTCPRSTIPSQGALWFAAERRCRGFSIQMDHLRGRRVGCDADNGEVRWKFQIPRPVNDAATLTAGGLVFTADLGGCFNAFDAKTGRSSCSMRWSINRRAFRDLLGKRPAACRDRIGQEVAHWSGARMRLEVVIFAV